MADNWNTAHPRSTAPISGALTDISGTLTAGGTAQSASTAKTRKYLYIENPKTATERLWFSTVTTAVAASPSIPLDPGEWFCFEGSFVPNTAVSVIAATTGHAWTGREA